ERTELLAFIQANNIKNVVFVAADIHGTLVNNLTYQIGPGQPQVLTGAFEITTGAIAYNAPF
ncbi:MAG: alkaline phosphatase D family protein, partial [Planctomycetia bacterium]